MTTRDLAEYQKRGGKLYHIDLGRNLSETQDGFEDVFISEYSFRFGGKVLRTKVDSAKVLLAADPSGRRLELELAQLPKPRGDRCRLAKMRIARHKHHRRPA
jgi:hypothetical protein